MCEHRRAAATHTSSLPPCQGSTPSNLAVSFWKILLSQPPLRTEVLRLHGAGKMAQGKRALATLVEDLGSIPSTLMGVDLYAIPQVPGNLTPSSGLCGYCMHVVYIYILRHTHNPHIHVK